MSAPKVDIVIERLRDTGVQNIGRMYLFLNGKRMMKCVSLELSWINNEPFISCISTGKYPVEKRNSPKYGDHLHVKDVPNRSYILIHVLNWFKQSEGCIGVGQYFKHLNDDNEYDITNSRSTLDQLLSHIPEDSDIMLTVKNHEDYQTIY